MWFVLPGDIQLRDTWQLDYRCIWHRVLCSTMSAVITTDHMPTPLLYMGFNAQAHVHFDGSMKCEYVSLLCKCLPPCSAEPGALRKFSHPALLSHVCWPRQKMCAQFLLHTAVYYCTLQCTTADCCILLHTAVYYHTLLYTTAHCCILHCCDVYYCTLVLIWYPPTWCKLYPPIHCLRLTLEYQRPM